MQLGSRFYTVTGLQTYVIEYEYNLGRDVSKSYDEFYFNIIGENWETVIGKVNFKITMPKDFDSTKMGFSKGGVGSSDQSNINYLVKNNIIEGTAFDFNPREALTIRIELNEGYFVNASLYNGYFGLLYIVPILLLIIAFVLWYKFGKDDIVTEVVSLYPPRNYNSLEIGFYYKGNVVAEDIISLIVYLANKGYLKIITEKEDDFKLIKLKDYDGDNAYEKTLFKGIFSKKKALKTDKIDELIKDGIVSSDVDRQVLRIVNKEDLAKSLQSPSESIYRKLTEKGKKEIYCDVSPKKTLLLLAFGVLSMMISYFVPLFTCYMGESLYVLMVVFTLFGYCGSFLVVSVFSNQYNESIKVNGKSVKMSKAKQKIVVSLLGVGLILVTGIPWIEIIRYVPNLFVLSVVAFLCGFGILICQIHMTKRNVFGREILGEIRGFKRFLETAEKQKLEALVHEDPTYFFDILPYAYVLGVSDKWINRFQDITLPDNIDKTTITITSSSIRSILLIQSLMIDVIDLSDVASGRIPKAFNKAASFSGTSFGGSSGGGFSGGGSGGGGGGAW